MRRSIVRCKRRSGARIASLHRRPRCKKRGGSNHRDHRAHRILRKTGTEPDGPSFAIRLWHGRSIEAAYRANHRCRDPGAPSLGSGPSRIGIRGVSRVRARETWIAIEKQKPLPVVYDDVNIDCAYRLDFVVNDEVVVEVTSVERLTHIHDAQLISYLKLSKKRVGLLINFNVKWLTDEGIRRRVNDPK